MEIGQGRSLSQDQFCWLENISRVKFQELLRSRIKTLRKTKLRRRRGSP